MKKQNERGRLPEAEAVPQGKATQIVMINTAALHPHPDNPRKDLGDLTELADSIRERGVLQNLTVVPFAPDYSTAGITIKGEFIIVIGHRRHAAAQLAGLAELPCVISNMTHIEQVGTMMLENLQRSDLTVIEQAAGFQMMMDLGETVDSIAAKTGFGKRTVQHRLNIAKLDREKVSEALHRGGTLLDFIELEKIRDEKKKLYESLAESQHREQAAVADLKLSAKEMQEGVGVCVVCKHYPEDMSRGLPEICDECAGTDQCYFEWRGPVAGEVSR